MPLSGVTLATLAALLLIAVLGTWTVVQRGLRAITPMALGLALPPLLFFAFSMTSAINLGLRHILPVFPFIYVGLAALAAGPWRTLQRAASTLVSTFPVNRGTL